MSRVGKMPIDVPKGVDVQLTADKITVKGSNGTLSRELSSHVRVKNDAGRVTRIESPVKVTIPTPGGAAAPSATSAATSGLASAPSASSGLTPVTAGAANG